MRRKKSNKKGVMIDLNLTITKAGSIFKYIIIIIRSSETGEFIIIYY